MKKIKGFDKIKILPNMHFFSVSNSKYIENLHRKDRSKYQFYGSLYRYIDGKRDHILSRECIIGNPNGTFQNNSIDKWECIIQDYTDSELFTNV